MRRKMAKALYTTNAFRWQILVLRDGGAYVSCKMSKVPVECQTSKKGQKFQSRDNIPKSDSTVGWGCKTSSLQTNCFVIDNTETQLIRHIALSYNQRKYN